MAKLKAPLLSLGASQQLGKALVFFGWKGLDVVREYVIPSNPNTTLQQAQRTRLTNAVTEIHNEQAEISNTLGPTDVTAYALWASVVQAATTWFNQAVRHVIDRSVLSLSYAIFRGGAFSAIGAAGFKFDIYSNRITAGAIITGQFKWGTSRTALINTKAATPALAAKRMDATWTLLASKTKYYVQFEALTTAPGWADIKSGIYHVTTT